MGSTSGPPGPGGGGPSVTASQPGTSAGPGAPAGVANPPALMLLSSHEEITAERYTADLAEVKSIGTGSFGCALLVESKSTGERFVAKKISLEHLTPDEQQNWSGLLHHCRACPAARKKSIALDHAGERSRRRGATKSSEGLRACEPRPR